jgi:hypothetical protein
MSITNIQIFPHLSFGFVVLEWCKTVAVWLVRDCGLFTYQVTENFEADYYTPKTTETLINYTACVRPA